MAREEFVIFGILLIILAGGGYFIPIPFTLAGENVSNTIPNVVAFCESGIGQFAQMSPEIVKICSEFKTLMLGIYGSGLFGIILIIVGAAKGDSKEKILHVDTGEVEERSTKEHDKSIDILKERYAKGEITKEQFVNMKNDLEGNMPIPNYKPEKEEEPEKEMKQIAEPNKKEEKMSQSTWIKSLIAVGVVSIILTIIVVSGAFPLMIQQTDSEQQEQNPQPVKSTSEDYSGNARSFTGKVTGIINGYTIQVDGQSVRFALASTPDVNTPMGIAAKQYLLQICPIGSTVTVDEDDGQTEGSYDGIVALVKCNGVNLNAAVIEKGFGHLIFVNCDKSEFAYHSWSRC